MDVEIVVEIRLYEVVDEGPDCRASLDSVRPVRLLDRIAVLVEDLLLVGVGGAELGLGLPLEVGLLNADADCPDDALTDVLGGIILLEELLEGLRDGLPERSQMRPSVAGVLPVHERRYVLPVVVAVGEHHLDVLPLKMNGGIERRMLGVEVVVHDVEKPVLRDIRRTVQRDGQPLVEVAVVLDHLLDELHLEMEISEHIHVRHEAHERSVLLLRAHVVPVGDLLFKPPPLERGAGHLSVTVGLDVEP